MLKTSRWALFALLTAVTHPALAVDAVTWDSSGNGLLKGTYNFREVTWRNKGDSHRIAIYGSMVFDGTGRYTLTASVMDSNSPGSPQSFLTTGAYTVAASGMGFMDDPTRPTLTGSPLPIWGLVSQGIFIGSTTDDGINNLLIAAPAPSPTPTAASFTGNYWTVGVNFPSSDLTQARDMLFPLNPDGQGNLGPVSLTGFVGSTTAAITQNVTGATYAFATNGALTLGFGGSLLPQTLIAGSVLCYLSPDGNFFFGGSATGWDMIVGVRAYAGTVPPNALQGMYYQAGVDVTPSGGFDTITTYYGAFSAGSGTIVGHQRLLNAEAAGNYLPFDYTYSDSFTLNPLDGSHEDFIGLHNIVGAAGAIRIGFGNQSRLGINIALRAPAFSGSGVYLNPTGIANAASSAPFTVGVSRGGFIALYGTNLASTTAQDATMPFSLGGVQVLINGRKAPVYFVRSDVVLAIVPFATTGTVASVQVLNGTSASDTRTVRIKNGTPGIYTIPPGGVGSVIAQHVQDNSYATITEQNPAHPGEIILLYLTGLGDVNPPVPDATPAPSNPLSYAKIQPLAVVDGEKANVGFAGLSPTLIGVYAMTVTIPADIAPGYVFLDIALPDSYTTEAQIWIGASNLANQADGQSASRPSLPRTPVRGNSRRFPNR